MLRPCVFVSCVLLVPSRTCDMCSTGHQSEKSAHAHPAPHKNISMTDQNFALPICEEVLPCWQWHCDAKSTCSNHKCRQKRVYSTMQPFWYPHAAWATLPYASEGHALKLPDGTCDAACWWCDGVTLLRPAILHLTSTCPAR